MELCCSDDVRAAAAILTEGFMEKFSSVGVSRDVAVGLMEALWENGENHRYFVEKTDTEVIAALHLKWNGPSPKKVSKKELYEKYGRRETSRYLKGMNALYEEVKDGDCYIAEFAVASEHRGKGIAGSVVKSTIDFAMSKGFSRLTLFVSDKNEVAIKLYEKLGFTTERVQKSFFEKLYFDEPKWRFMTINLDKSDQ